MRIDFKCKNNIGCNGHTSALISWQYMQAFRNFREKYGSSENAFEVIKHELTARFSDDRSGLLLYWVLILVGALG
jgi:hypothetical protein